MSRPDAPTPAGDATPRGGARRADVQDAFFRNCARVELDGRDVPRIGNVAITAKIGAGGMGVVFRGRHLALDVDVALKVLPPSLSDPHGERAQRFHREARIAARLRSDHLVWVMDVGEDAATGCLYIVMEYVRGISADQWARGVPGGRPDERQVAEIAIAACRGIQAAHQAGVVHRDVKPSNILLPLDAEGAPRLSAAKVADLGLARDVHVEGDVTATQAALGTPGYLAPEQTSDAHRAGKPADVFGMGATIYSLLVGEAPFAGTTPMHALMRTMAGEFAPLRTRRGDVTPALEAVVTRCLAPDPAARYPDARALRKALEAVAAGRPAPEEPGRAAPRRDGPAAPAPRTPPAPTPAPVAVAAPAVVRRRSVRVRRGRPAPVAAAAVVGVTIVVCGAVVATALRPPPSVVLTAPADARRTGTLRFSGLPPGARADVGGRAVGDGSPLDPGEHEVRIVRTDGTEARVTVAVDAGEDVVVVVPAPRAAPPRPAAGTLRLPRIPAGARVELGERVLLDGAPLPPGEHALRVVYAGGATRSVRATIRAGEETVVAVPPPPAAKAPIPKGLGRIVLTGVPEEVRVTVDGRSAGPTCDVAPGDHEVRVTLLDGRVVSFRTTVVAGDETVLDVRAAAAATGVERSGPLAPRRDGPDSGDR